VVHPAGSVLDLDALASAEGGLAWGQGDLSSAEGGVPAPAPAVAQVEEAPVFVAASSLRAAAAEAAARFDEAMARRDVDACVDAILALEQSMLDWSADTLTSDEGDYARAQLRTMVLRLGELAVIGARDPRAVVEPFVEAMLELRGRARDAHDWTTSDWIRDRLAGASIEVRDTPTGPQWHLLNQDHGQG
jgi:cysteinyl-tRNA synthetase